MAKKEIKPNRKVNGLNWLVPPVDAARDDDCKTFQCGSFICATYTCATFDNLT